MKNGRQKIGQNEKARDVTHDEQEQETFRGIAVKGAAL